MAVAHEPQQVRLVIYAELPVLQAGLNILVLGGCLQLPQYAMHSTLSTLEDGFLRGTLLSRN